MNFFRSGRTPANMSKRFPTKEPEKRQAQIKPQEQEISKPHPRRKGKPSVQFDSFPIQNGNLDTAPSKSKVPKKKAPPTQSKSQSDKVPGKESTPHDQSSAQKPEETAKPSSSDRAMPESKPSGSDSGDADYDLRPPQLKPKPSSIETLSVLLFSEGYLSTITTDPQLLARFTKFLNKYMPDIAHYVLRYLETQKIIKAIDYANAVASTLENTEGSSSPAAQLSASFLESSKDAFNTLLTTALPAWVTYSLVKTATSCLTAEITNQATPLTRDLVGGLSEVFCLTDPTQEDNPIVYSSREFYRLTGYDKESVIGHNCRFLQGPKTKPESRQRLKKAIDGGEEICETLLNYRRDGRPFINVLMLAPLHDDKGKVKYYLGAQVDASRLVEGGRGVDGYERFLVKREMESERGRSADTNPKRKALAKLRDLSLAFDLEESAVVQSNSRSSSMTRGDEGSVASTERQRTGRRVLHDDDENSGSDDDDDDDKDNPAWNLSRNKMSGSLPGVYQKYLLIRPYPSLRIIFVSQAVRKMGQLQQRPFLAHVAAPSPTLSGLKESFQSGTAVTAKIAIMAQTGKSRDGTATGRWGRRKKEDNGGEDPAKRGKTCWISATPLLDSNNKPGVWMVVIVDKASVASNTGRRLDAELFPKSEAAEREQESSLFESVLKPDDLPIKPKPAGRFDLEFTTPESPLLAATAEEEPEQLLNHDADEAAERKDTDANGDENGLGTVKEPQEKSQRSESLLQEGMEGGDAADANTPPIIESTNGSPVPESGDAQHQDEDDDHQDIEQEGPATPTRENHELAVDTTPKPGGGSGRRDVGLRAMDYLSSHSPVHKRQMNGVEGKENMDEIDWNLASPYSVD